MQDVADCRRPNILFVICHDLGRHTGCYGASVATPNIDRLAAEGVRFENAHCTAPQCSPSRSSIMTGLSPHANGMMGLAHIGWEIDPGVKKLPEYFGDIGYDTHLFGVQHESSDRQSLGYGTAHASVAEARQDTETLVRWLHERSSERSPRPFFVNLGLQEPHRPYPQDSSEYDIDDPAKIDVPRHFPDRPGIRKDLAGLHGLIKRVDESVGRLMQSLDSLSMSENTLMVFTTDHGIAMPRAKGMCYDLGTGVCLIMRLPGRFEGGTIHNDLVSNVDFLPTLLEIAGGSAPGAIEGRSFRPLLDGEAYTPRDHVFSEMTWHCRYNPIRAVRTHRFRYIRNFHRLPLVFYPFDVYHGLAGQEMLGEGYSSIRPEEELYDLQDDPLETKNLVDSAEHSDVKSELGRTLERWMHDTRDPLLEGFVPPTEKQWQREVLDALSGKYQRFDRGLQ